MKRIILLILLLLLSWQIEAKEAKKPKKVSSPQLEKCLDKADLELPYNQANLPHILTFDYEKTLAYISKHLEGTTTKVGFIKQRIEKLFFERGFIEDKHLSKLNRAKDHKVYRDPNNPKTLYTIDTRHCAIETFDSKGRHQGEVNFDFEFNTKGGKKDNAKSHDIIVQ